MNRWYYGRGLRAAPLFDAAGALFILLQHFPTYTRQTFLTIRVTCSPQAGGQSNLL
ncbi:MAG TPA: hypothetical protein VFO39_00265 [Candidatus Sulfotelmatobacter sp.]|nr:hypothetical protein [Candidatus Sulfotelmatobacter sp.]